MSDDLSKPPPDTALLEEIVRNVLDDHSDETFVPLSVLMREVQAECPDTLSRDDVLREILQQLKHRNLAVQFDKPVT